MIPSTQAFVGTAMSAVSLALIFLAVHVVLHRHHLIAACVGRCRGRSPNSSATNISVFVVWGLLAVGVIVIVIQLLHPVLNNAINVGMMFLLLCFESLFALTRYGQVWFIKHRHRSLRITEVMMMLAFLVALYTCLWALVSFASPVTGMLAFSIVHVTVVWYTSVRFALSVRKSYSRSILQTEFPEQYRLAQKELRSVYCNALLTMISCIVAVGSVSTHVTLQRGFHGNLMVCVWVVVTTTFHSLCLAPNRVCLRRILCCCDEERQLARHVTFRASIVDLIGHLSLGRNGDSPRLARDTMPPPALEHPRITIPKPKATVAFKAIDIQSPTPNDIRSPDVSFSSTESLYSSDTTGEPELVFPAVSLSHNCSLEMLSMERSQSDTSLSEEIKSHVSIRTPRSALILTGFSFEISLREVSFQVSREGVLKQTMELSEGLTVCGLTENSILSMISSGQKTIEVLELGE